MTIHDDMYYRALTARDNRFDGVFFVGVKSTGIYCRPVCTAKTPGRDRCLFFSSAAIAEQAGFRPCLRCRPECAPGVAPIDSVRNVAHAAAARIEAGALNNGSSLETLATDLGLSSRQLRRSMKQELGLSPVELAQTNRLLLAKRLIAETQLSMTEIAFAAGFESVRRFNALFRTHYRLTPSELRRSTAKTEAGDRLRLTLAYRPPLDWEAMMRFLKKRAIPGVECVQGSTYHRTVAVGEHRGWLSVSPVPGRHMLAVDLSTSLTPALPLLLVRLRSFFDLDARPDLIEDHLKCSPVLAPMVERQTGLRVPGAFDAFEIGVRAIVGQQVTVRCASVLAGRLAERFGEAIETPLAELTRLPPSTTALSAARDTTIANLGLPLARAKSLRNLARVITRGEIDLEPSADPTEAVKQLVQLPGIGAWTAQYIAMRALRWPDAFPTGDVGLLKASQLTSAKALDELAELWRPWRSYAVIHLWQSLANEAR